VRTFDARVGIEGGDPPSMAKAMGQALDDAVAQVADVVRLGVRADREAELRQPRGRHVVLPGHL
jgi:hypothetical protein